jgi:hypothetical protein
MERKHNPHFNLLWQEGSLLTFECIMAVKDTQSEKVIIYTQIKTERMLI